jgi:hypothetical protein
MKAPLVHTFMRKHFLPFLYLHGLERPVRADYGEGFIAPRTAHSQRSIDVE